MHGTSIIQAEPHPQPHPQLHPRQYPRQYPLNATEAIT